MNLRGLARSRWRLFRNSVLGARKGGKSRASRPLLAGVLGSLLAVLIYFSIFLAFSALAEAGADARASGVLLGLILSGALAGMLAFDLHEAVATLVSDSDLQILRLAPIPPALVFAIKLLDALPRTSVAIVALAAPSIVAYALVYPLAAWGWLALAPVLFCLWLVPVTLGSAAALALLRFIPARLAKETMGLLTTLAIMGLWLANSFLLPRAADQAPTAVAWLEGMASDAPLGFRLSPGAWGAEILVAAANRDPASLVRPAIGLLLAAAGALGLAAWSAAANLSAVQSRLVGGRKARPRAGRARAPSRRAGFVGAMLVRDGRLLLRDWPVLTDVLITCVLWTLLPLVIIPAGTIPSPSLLRAMLLGLSVGLGYEVGARALPFERRGISWARLAPVPTLQWTMARWLGTVLLSVPLVAIAAFLCGPALGLPASESLWALGETLPALVLAISVGLWTGARFGNPEWKQPRAMLTVTGRLVAMVFLFAQSIGWIGWMWQGEPAGAVVPALASLASLLALLAAAQALRRGITS